MRPLLRSSGIVHGQLFPNRIVEGLPTRTKPLARRTLRVGRTEREVAYRLR
jgi:hypothetical protein